MPEEIFPYIPFLVGTAFAAAGFLPLYRIRTLHRKGAKAPGIVVALEDSSSTKGGTLQAPVVAWTTHDGQHRRETAPVGKSVILAHRPGTPVTVHYNPTNPTHWHLDGYGTTLYWTFALLGTAILTGTTLVHAFLLP